ncbi:D-arabinose 5-phosphate isomerase, partial [Vibrio cholerae]|nr:D-arabinose 5-phosphate isomerase [Vibrio cholerae]
MHHSFDYQTVAKQVLATEIHALQQLEQYINDDFARACAMILANQTGKVVVMG